MPSAQGAPFGRISSAADADGRDEHGAQAGGTAAGRGTLSPSAQSSARPSGRATEQAAGRKADGRDGAAGEVSPSDGRVALSPTFCGRWWYDYTQKGEKTSRRAKKRESGY